MKLPPSVFPRFQWNLICNFTVSYPKLILFIHLKTKKDEILTSVSPLYDGECVCPND